jgi:hypothetical protein
LITEIAVSSRLRGSWAASSALNCRFLGFAVMSFSVALTPTPSFSVIRPF